MTEALRVGFVGVGDQGAPMAARILAAGFPLAGSELVFDPTVDVDTYRQRIQAALAGTTS